MSEIANLIQSINDKYVNCLVDGKCAKCGTKIKILPQEKSVLCDKCELEKQKRKENLQKLEYIIPVGYRQMTFENFVVRDKIKNLQTAVEAAKRFVHNDTGVYLYGQPGHGKTHLLIAALRECVFAGHSVKLLRYCTELKNFKTMGWKKEDFFSEYCSCKCLFVDDFGSAGTKDEAIDILYGILQRRIEHDKSKKIFITANVGISAIDDDRIKSRIIGMCTNYCVHDNGVDSERYVNVIELAGNDIRLKGVI